MGSSLFSRFQTPLNAGARLKGCVERHLVQSAIVAAMLLSILSTEALAQASEPVLRSLPSSAAPTELYHWTDAAGLEKISKSLKDGRLLANRVRDDHRLGSAFPSLIDRPALYAWPDSVVGIGTTTEELYPTRNELRPELVRLRLRSDLRVVEVHSDGMEFTAQKISAAANQKLLQADLILHQWTLDGEIALKEWIVVNPRAVLELETEPERLRPDIERDWKRLPETIQDPRRLHWSLNGSMLEEICIVCHEYGRDLVRDLLDQFLDPKTSQATRPRGPICANVFSQ